MPKVREECGVKLNEVERIVSPVPALLGANGRSRTVPFTLTIYYLPALLRSTIYTNDEARCLFCLTKGPPFAAGLGWDYSETNYIVAGMIIETVPGKRL